MLLPRLSFTPSLKLDSYPVTCVSLLHCSAYARNPEACSAYARNPEAIRDTSSFLTPFWLAFIKAWQFLLWIHFESICISSPLLPKFLHFSPVLLQKASSLALSLVYFIFSKSYQSYLFKMVHLMIMCLLSQNFLITSYWSYNKIISGHALKSLWFRDFIDFS